MSGLNVPAENIFTSAMATARFLQNQRPNGTAFVVGEVGLTQALHEVGYVQTDTDPDYVVLGEVNNYNFEQITRAIRLINDGALFIATNPDATGPLESGIVPATGAMAALIEKATGKAPFFVGKPNPLMMRSAMRYLIPTLLPAS
jgi:NagD protein